jgi:DNA helicase INO80
MYEICFYTDISDYNSHFNKQERKILRQFWDQKDLHTREASFHVVITSYQLVITDFKYFNRIKWQYLILDEAQALKSTNR